MILKQRNVCDYGTGDDDLFDTAAIRMALDDYTDEGGEVHLPPGMYRSALFYVDDDTTFRLAGGAGPRFTQDFTEFPTVESRWEG